MPIPYIGFDGGTLKNAPEARAGDLILCPRCFQQHPLVGGTDAATGEASNMLLFYKCQGELCLAGVDGRLVMGLEADVSGEL